jgi:hypothetical protein
MPDVRGPLSLDTDVGFSSRVSSSWRTSVVTRLRQTSSGGTLTLAVTQQGNSTPFGANPYASSMSVNPGTSSPTGFTIVESTFNDPGNGLYPQTPADLLSTDTFTAIRADGPLTNISLNDPNPFSVTDLYTITAKWVHSSCAVQFQSHD